MPHQIRLSCERAWRELSNFIDGDVDPFLRAAIQQHLRECRHCAALYNSTRNVITLFRDERLVQAPTGYSERLHAFLAEQMKKGAVR